MLLNEVDDRDLYNEASTLEFREVVNLMQVTQGEIRMRIQKVNKAVEKLLLKQGLIGQIKIITANIAHAFEENNWNHSPYCIEDTNEGLRQRKLRMMYFALMGAGLEKHKKDDEK